MVGHWDKIWVQYQLAVYYDQAMIQFEAFVTRK